MDEITLDPNARRILWALAGLCGLVLASSALAWLRERAKETESKADDAAAEAATNTLETVTGRDLDGDGDVGKAGKNGGF